MRQIGLSIVLAILALWHTVAYCVVPVIDESTVYQTTLTALHTLDSVHQQATQLQQDWNFYTQQARHLVSLPVSMIEQISQTYSEYNDLLNQGRSIAYTTTKALSDFEQLYQTASQGNIPFTQRAQQMLGQVRELSRTLTAVSAIYTRLCQDQGNVQTLLAASQSSPGTLSAIQAQTQLLGVMTSQQASLQEIGAATSRVQMGFIMREITAEERAQWNASRFMEGYGDGAFRGPHQGQGSPLPE
jgi:P-type conjugative transfer protein TrbJ